MKILFERSFLNDVRSVKDKSTLRKLSEIISVLKSVNTMDDIPNLKKLKGHPSAFRIKLGNYRLGFFLETDTLILVRYQHRKDIYKKFP